MKYFTPVFILLLILGQSPTTRTTQDDAAVYDAVIEHTLRAEFQRHGGASTNGMRPTIWLAGQTVPLCEGPRDVSLGCVAQSDVGLTLTSQTGERIPPERLPSAAALAELTADFRSRNRASRELPPPHADGVRALTAPELHEMQQRLINAEGGNYASFSLPAYSSDGLAVVHVGYVCGNVCGKWWLFLLQKVDSKWHVQGRKLLGIA